MKGTGKSYTVKEWFATKIANEAKMNISACDVFAIIKETDKAVYALLNIGHGHCKTTWIPKSALVEREVYMNPFKEANYETYIASDYKEALNNFRTFWAEFC